ncbi:MAG: vitamin K epoxide reductase family protein [Leptolyngbyaceae bacterium]|nr:vitamin K epoxide reductase family protein [Leptolyngbyaceae bacterium]
MVRRRQSTPWIQRHSRIIIGAIAIVGALLTAYLTVIEFTGGEAACPTSGCNVVLASPYAKVFGLPLAMFGMLGYAAMAIFALGPLAVKPETNKLLRSQLEDTSWLFLFMGGCAMAVFSTYLVYLLIFEIKAFCPYCATSAILSLALFVMALIGRHWEDVGQIAFTGILVVFVTLVGVVGLYSSVSRAEVPSETVTGVAPPPIQNESGPSEIALAQHLQDIGATKYSAYWCPHCQQQRELFGREAFEYIDTVECAEDGQNAQPQLCRQKGIQGFPTWEINGELYSGARPLGELADLSGYTGPRDFRHSS